jgi:hypothetical protein
LTNNWGILILEIHLLLNLMKKTPSLWKKALLIGWLLAGFASAPVLAKDAPPRLGREACDKTYIGTVDVDLGGGWTLTVPIEMCFNTKAGNCCGVIDIVG